MSNNLVSRHEFVHLDVDWLEAEYQLTGNDDGLLVPAADVLAGKVLDVFFFINLRENLCNICVSCFVLRKLYEDNILGTNTSFKSCIFVLSQPSVTSAFGRHARR